MGPDYIFHFLIVFLINSIIVVSLSVTIGKLGLLSLGNMTFFAVGAYFSVLTNLNGLPFIFSFLGAGLIGAIMVVFITFIMKRVKGDYFVVGTLAFALIVSTIFIGWSSLTRGPLGIPGIPKPEIFGYVFNSNLEYFLLVLFIFLIYLLFLYLLSKSPFYLVLDSIRDNELGSKILGYNTFKIKLVMMGIIGFLTGLAGSLHSHYISFIDSSIGNIHLIAYVLVLVIVGGIGSVRGAIASTFVIMITLEFLSLLSLPGDVLGPLRQMLYAVVLILVIWLRPKGIFGRVEL